MYSGAHLTGRLGAAQCASLVAAGERNSSAVADTNAYAHTDSHAHPNPHTHTQANTNSHSHTDASPDSNTKSNTSTHAIARWIAEAPAHGLLAGLQ